MGNFVGVLNPTMPLLSGECQVHRLPGHFRPSSLILMKKSWKQYLRETSRVSSLDFWVKAFKLHLKVQTTWGCTCTRESPGVLSGESLEPSPNDVEARLGAASPGGPKCHFLLVTATSSC